MSLCPLNCVCAPVSLVYLNTVLQCLCSFLHLSKLLTLSRYCFVSTIIFCGILVEYFLFFVLKRFSKSSRFNKVLLLFVIFESIFQLFAGIVINTVPDVIKFNKTSFYRKCNSLSYRFHCNWHCKYPTTINSLFLSTIKNIAFNFPIKNMISLVEKP